MTIKRECDVVIIGGGLAGAATALFLRKFNLSVILLEKGFCGAQASGVNYGGVRRQGRAPCQMALSQHSFEIWQSLSELIGTDGEYQKDGHLKLARTPEDFIKLQNYAKSVEAFPLNLQLFDKNDVQKYFPWLKGDITGASLCPQDGQANPRLVAPAFARAAERLGAEVLELNEVSEASHNGHCFTVKTAQNYEIRAQFLVNAAGAWANTIANWFDEPVPLKRIYPQLVVTEPIKQQLPINLGQEGGGFYCRQVERGNFIAGGGRGNILKNDDYSRPSGEDLLTLMSDLAELFPALNNAMIIRSWTGTEGETPDDQPIIGFSTTTPNLIHAFGFSGAGFQITPGVGSVIARLIAQNKTIISLDPFKIDRF